MGARYALDVQLTKEREVRTEREGVPPEVLADRGEAHVVLGVEVIERDDAHERLRYTVTAATHAAYFRHPFLLQGAQVFVVLSRPGRYEVTDGAGAPVPGPLLRSFTDFVDVGWSRPDEGDDAVFGSPTPQPVGGAWPIRPASPDHGTILGGTVHLTATRPCADSTCLVLHADVSTRVEPAEAQASLHIEQRPATVTLDVWLPVDATRPVRRTTSVTRESHVVVDDAQHVRRTVDGTYATVRALTPAP